MTHLTYLAVLAACLAGMVPLEVLLHTGVVRRWRRLAAAVLPVTAVFVVWDSLAVRAGHWWYDPARITGLRVGNLPVEEVLFFLVVPFCAVEALEAVRAVKARRGWTFGDERDPAHRDGAAAGPPRVAPQEGR